MNATKTTANGREKLAAALELPTAAPYVNREPPAWCRKLFPGTWARLETVWIGEVTVTPEVAAKVLEERNPRNRHMNDGQLARLISAMAAGQFRITGDTVVFDCKGNIQNAQHRFTACRDSGVTVKMLVVVGVPEDSFRTYDQHARRSLAQILGMENEESATVLAGLIYRVCSFLTTGNFAQGNNGTRAMTTEDLVAARDKYDGLRESVAFACGIPKLEARKFHGQTIIATLHWVLGKVDRPLAEEFLLAVCSSSIPKDRRWDPARLLAARLNGKSKLHRGETEVLAVKAWNALQAVKRPERLNLGKKGSFPEVAGWVYSNGRPLPQ